MMTNKPEEQPTYEDLTKRVQDLEGEIQKISDQKIARRRRFLAGTGFLSRVLIRTFLSSHVYENAVACWDGWSAWLSNPVKGAWPEMQTKRLAASVLARFTRIGLVIALIALIPLISTFAQLWLLSNQNRLIQAQNELAEASRRSALVFELSSILDAMGREIEEQAKNVDSKQFMPIEPLTGDIAAFVRPTNRWELSDLLTGRIIALSRSLRPYRYLEYSYSANDERQTEANVSKRPLSPERGQLLISLVESRVKIDQILHQADFSYADLQGATFIREDFSMARLRGANLKGAVFNGCDLTGVDLRDSDMAGAFLTNETDLTSSNLQGANLLGAEANSAVFEGAQVESQKWLEKHASVLDGKWKLRQQPGFSYYNLTSTTVSDDGQ